MRERLATLFDRVGLTALLRRFETWNGLLVLNYHRIGDPEGSPYDHGLFSATAEDFRAQVKFLKTHFQLVDPTDLPTMAERPDDRYVMITFDDGYRDNFDVARPILKEFEAPAAFFIATGFIDRPRVPWWDEVAWMVRTTNNRGTLPAGGPIPREFSLAEEDHPLTIRDLLRLYKQLPGTETAAFLEHLAEQLATGRCSAVDGEQMWMNWEMIRTLHREGFVIGGHTVNHPILGNLSLEDQDREIGGCAERLRDELGGPVRSFSYPVGGPTAFNELTRACLQYHGFTHSFSYSGGFGDLEHLDRFDIPRTAVELDVTMPRLRSRMAFPQMFS